MSKRAARFTQADVERALKGVSATLTPTAVEIAPDGTIRIVTAPLLTLSGPPRNAPRGFDERLEQLGGKKK